MTHPFPLIVPHFTLGLRRIWGGMRDGFEIQIWYYIPGHSIFLLYDLSSKMFTLNFCLWRMLPKVTQKGLGPSRGRYRADGSKQSPEMGPRRQEMRQSGVILRVAQTLLTCGSQSVPVPSCCFFAQTCHWKCPKGFFELSSSANGPSLPSSTPCTSAFQILGNHLLCSLRLVSSWTSWIVTVNSGPWSPLKISFNCISLYMSFSHF